MIDNKLLRRSLDAVAANLARRGNVFDRARYTQLEQRRRTLQVEIDALHARRNTISGQVKSCTPEQRAQYLSEAAQIKPKLVALESSFRGIKDEQLQFLYNIPNLVLDNVPDGLDESENQLVRACGSKPSFAFEPKNHFDLCSHDMDFAAAAKTAGSRFVVLRSSLARLHRALAQWMLDKHTGSHGYTEVYIPYIVEESSLIGTGQLPKFADDLFRIDSEKGQYLIPTAEVPVTNLVRESILDTKDLPLRFVAHSPCFRSEAGSYGKDTAGMIRQHQFEKVELVQICQPDNSAQALQELLGHAESILQDLGLAYRVMHLCAGDTGFSSASTYDLEVWLPGQKCYREISSCSNFTDFQSRRSGIRFRNQGEKPQLAHTVNGSALAVGRTLIALMENLQSENSRLQIPQVLQSYMGGATEIELR